MFEIGSTEMQTQPDAARVFKAEETVRWLSGLFGIPQMILETESETDERQQAQAQMQQQMQQMAMMQQGAEIANKAAPAIDVLKNETTAAET